MNTSKFNHIGQCFANIVIESEDQAATELHPITEAMIVCSSLAGSLSIMSCPTSTPTPSNSVEWVMWGAEASCNVVEGGRGSYDN